MNESKSKLPFLHVAASVSLLVMIAGLAWSPRSSFDSPWQADRNYRLEACPMDLVWYAGKRKALTVVFHDGSIYEYYNVPTRVFRELMATQHKGGYFNGRIRGSFNYCQLR